MDPFIRRKIQQLSKIDRSSIGDVDNKIKKLCDKINNSDSYYTTSSCAGRIALIKDPLAKKPGLFLFRSHDKINFEDLKKEIEKIENKEKGMVFFKQEPCLIVVACKTFTDASDLLDKSREECGWKNSGIMTLKKRIIVEMKATEELALPLIWNGKLLVDEGYLKLLVKEANKRLERTWEKIHRLEKLI